MKVWTNNEFEGHWPVGTAAVVVADTIGQACRLLNDELELRGLGRPAKEDQFKPLPTNRHLAVVLRDGDY